MLCKSHLRFVSTLKCCPTLLHTSMCFHCNLRVDTWHALRCVTLLLLFSHSVVSSSATPWTVALQASLAFALSGVCSETCPLSQWCHLTFCVTTACFPVSLGSKLLERWSLSSFITYCSSNPWFIVNVQYIFKWLDGDKRILNNLIMG